MRFVASTAEGIDTSLRTASRVGDDDYAWLSGDYWYWGWGYFRHVDLRDNEMTLSADYLPAGTYTYRLRASVPGTFQTMPTTAYSFYFPEIFGRAAGTLFTVNER